MACSPPSSTSLLLALGLLSLLSQVHVTSAVHHEVGDLNGKWGVESYFQAGDSLSFSHHAHSTEVQRVTREDYKACKAAKPIETYRGSRNNVATLGEATTYYFISGDSKLCMKGRKLMVVVQQQATGSTGAPATAPASPTATSPTPTSVATPPAAPTPTPTTTAAAPAPVAPPPTAATSPAAPTVPAPAAGEPTAEVPPIASSPAGSPEGAPGSSISSPPPPPNSPSASPGLPPAPGSSATALIISSSSSSYALALICTSLLLLLA